MKFHPSFRKKLNCSTADELFPYLISTFKDTVKGWDYFVNWDKANANLRGIEVHLNTLNYLIGKDNIEAEARLLFQENPKLLKTVPILLASREKKTRILKEYQLGSFAYEDYNFSDKITFTAERAVEFLSKTGFFKQLQTKRIKSIVDYVFGVEVGLDSNGRKNRSGTSMETIVEFYVDKCCTLYGYTFMKQATAEKLQTSWGKTITVDKASRAIDFAIKTPKRLFLLEVNFYGGGGSKLKSTAGEYKSDFRRWSDDGHQFIWITDGAGWRTSHKALRETFDVSDYILNLDMLEKGILDDILSS